MKKLLAILSILAFLLVAGPVSADWLDDLKPLPRGIIHISVKFHGNIGIVSLKNKNGNCTEYKVVDGNISKMRKCGDIVWGDFVKK